MLIDLVTTVLKVVLRALYYSLKIWIWIRVDIKISISISIISESMLKIIEFDLKTFCLHDRNRFMNKKIGNGSQTVGVSLTVKRWEVLELFLCLRVLE